MLTFPLLNDCKTSSMHCLAAKIKLSNPFASLTCFRLPARVQMEGMHGHLPLAPTQASFSIFFFTALDL
jgi:hypothetical protein